MNDVNSIYGDRDDQIDPFFKAKRKWSEVKDEILGKYIDCYLKTIQHRRRPIIIVDAFSGPGRFGDGSIGSPLIMCKTIDKMNNSDVGIGCIFSDTKTAHRTALEACLCEYINKGIAKKPLSDFSEALTHALKLGKNLTLFFYLDPYGIKDLDFDTVKQIYERDTNQSTEVLINFNFRTFMRMSGNWNYNDSTNEIANRVRQSKVETVNKVMGGDYWIPIITNSSLNKIQREEAVVEAYMDRVRKFFQYTYSIPIKELNDGSGIPVDDLAKYHLIFGTRSPRAILYMNDVAKNALQPYFNQFRDGLLFELTPERYEQAPEEKVKSAIIEAVSEEPMTRPQIYESVVTNFFLQYLKKDYRAMIDILVFNEKKLFANPQTLRRNNKLNDDTLISNKPWSLE